MLYFFFTRIIENSRISYHSEKFVPYKINIFFSLQDNIVGIFILCIYDV